MGQYRATRLMAAADMESLWRASAAADNPLARANRREGKASKQGTAESAGKDGKEGGAKLAELEDSFNGL